MRRIEILVVAVLFLPQTVSAADVLFFTGSPTSVANGQTRTITPTDQITFKVIRHIPQFPSFNSAIEFNIATPINAEFPERFKLVFAGPLESLPTTGFYPNVVSYPPLGSGQPSFLFGADNLSANPISGQFEVIEASFDSDGNLLKFAADFTQYDYGDVTKWNFGSIRYHSDIPLNTVPEPSTLALLTLGGVIAFAAKRR